VCVCVCVCVCMRGDPLPHNLNVSCRALLQSSSLIGNLLSYFVLPSGNITAHEAHFFYLILFGAASGGTLLFLLLRAPPRTRPNTLNTSGEDTLAHTRPSVMESVGT
jgi:hypothetical protein